MESELSEDITLRMILCLSACSGISSETLREMVSEFANLPRRDYIEANAAALIKQRDIKIARQRAVIRRLEDSVRSLKQSKHHPE